MSKLYVGNLSWHTTDETLRAAFQEHGAVQDAVVMRDRDTGRSRGFGFVNFSNDNEAIAAMESLNDTELDGRRIRVDRASGRPAAGGGGYGGRGGDREYGGGAGGY